MRKQEGKMSDEWPDYLREHSKYLVKVDPEKLQAKLGLFGLQPADLHPMPLICNLKEIGPIILTPKKRFDPHVGEMDRYVHTITPRSIQELKELVGVPNRVMEKNVSYALRREVSLYQLPSQDEMSFESLEAERRTAVFDMAHNLVYGYADEERMSKPPLSGIVKFVLERSQELPLFVAQDLIVCPDETIEFNNFAALYFNNVVVYGSGRIKLGNNTKLHAVQVTHVP